VIAFFQENGIYVLAGVVYSLLLLVLALSIALPLGGIVCYLGTGRSIVGRAAARIYIECVRATPGILLLFVLYYGLATTGVALSAISATALTLGLVGSVQVAEILRGAIDAVPRHQRDAGLSLGLTEWQVVQLILAPQAIRIATPALVSVAAFTLKDSAMGLLVAVPEVMYRAHDVGSRTFQSMGAFTIAMGTYMVLCIPLSLAGRALERSLTRSGTTTAADSPSTLSELNLPSKKLLHRDPSSS